MSDGIRRKRLGGTILRHLSEQLARQVADPRLAALSIQSVDVSGDLSVAKVSVRLMFGGEEELARKAAMNTLQIIAPGLRASLAPVLRMRRLPELRFIYDLGADQRERISDILGEIKRDDEAKRQDAGEDELEKS